MPGPETADATGDPIVITRYLYKPDYDEGLTHFNDNRRLHIFVADIASGQIRQLTDGTHYEHSIDWSPDGREIAFVSNREPNEDQFFNYDLFALNVASGAIRRLTATENAEYQPRWSPDGKTDRLPRYQARPHRSRNHHGRHARLADRRRSAAIAASWAGIDNRQFERCLVARRQMGLLHRAEARQQCCWPAYRPPAARPKPL